MQSISELESIMISVKWQYMRMRVGCDIGSVERHSGILFNALSKFQIENWSSVTVEKFFLFLSRCWCLRLKRVSWACITCEFIPQMIYTATKNSEM